MILQYVFLSLSIIASYSKEKLQLFYELQGGKRKPLDLEFLLTSYPARALFVLGWYVVHIANEKHIS